MERITLVIVITDYSFTDNEVNRLTQLVTPDGTSDYGYNDRNELEASDHIKAPQYPQSR